MDTSRAEWLICHPVPDQRPGNTDIMLAAENSWGSGKQTPAEVPAHALPSSVSFILVMEIDLVPSETM